MKSIIRSSNLFSIIILLIITIISLVNSNISILINTVIFYLLGYFIIKIQRIDFYRSITIYNLFFLVYILYAYITDLVYVKNINTDFFYTLDSVKYYGYSEQIENRTGKLEEYLFEYRFAPGYGYIVYFINLINKYFNGYNQVFIHKIHIVSISASIISFTYMIAVNLLNKIDKNKIFKYIIVYGFLSHFLTFSALLIRDIHIVYLFTLSFLYLSKKNEVKNLLILLLLVFLTFQFRTANGVFSLVFIAMFFYKNVLQIKNKTKRDILKYSLFFIVIIIFVLMYSFINIFEVGDVNSKMENYEAYHDEMLQNSTGLGQVVYQLPVFIRPFIFILISQVAPIPSFQIVHLNVNKETQYFLLTLAISIIFWLYVDFILIINLIRRKIKFKKNTLLKYFILISVIFLILTSTTSPEYRRLLPVYPILYIYFIYIHISISKYNRSLYTSCFFIIYVLICTLILFIK